MIPDLSDVVASFNSCPFLAILHHMLIVTLPMTKIIGCMGNFLACMMLCHEDCILYPYDLADNDCLWEPRYSGQ
jgi:hypothetical protein